MSDLPVYPTPTKAELVQAAYAVCGQAGYEFAQTPEETDGALGLLEGMMAEWEADGIVLGYNHSSYGNGVAAENSGIPLSAKTAVTNSLALLIAPGMGKTLSPEAKAAMASSLSRLRSRTLVIPSMQLGRQTIRGAGNRWLQNFGPYFVTTVSDAETPQ